MEIQEYKKLTKEEKIKKLAEIIEITEEESNELYERSVGYGDR